MKSFFVRLTKYCTPVALLALAVLLPLIYLPLTVEPRDLAKQVLLVALVVVATLVYSLHIITTRTLTIRRDWRYLVFLLFIIVLLITPGVRQSPYLSLLGQSGQEYVSLVSLLMYGLIFFLGADFLQTASHRQHLASALLIGGALTSLLTLPIFFGWTSFPILIGTPNTLAIYLICLSTFGLGLWLTNAQPLSKLARLAIIITTIVSTLTLLAIDYSPLWIISLVGLGSLFLIALVKTHHFPKPQHFLAPLFLLAVSVLFLLVPSPWPSPFSAEIAPTPAASLSIAVNSLAEQPLVGSGAGTYSFDYAKHYPLSLNSTKYWATTFNSANSYFLTILPTFGLLGTGLYLLLCLSILIGALTALFVTPTKAQLWSQTNKPAELAAPLSAWLVLFVAQFLISSNLTLSFLFWLLSAILAGLTIKRLSTYNFDHSPRTGLLATCLSVFVLLGLVTTLFVVASGYAAELSFQRAVNLGAANADSADIIAALDHAAVINRWNDLYYRNLAHLLLVKTASVMQQPDADATYLQQLVSSSLAAAKRATELGRNNVANWYVLGTIYQEIAPAVPTAIQFELAAFTQAHTLVPQDPAYLVSLARAYLAEADAAAVIINGDDKSLVAAATASRTAALDSALTNLLAAQTLKPDYAPTGYYLAGVYERQGKLADAISGLEALRTSHPNDVGVGVQLALLYLKQGKNDLAQTELERILKISPDYADAHWYLATIYENKGDLEDAITQVEAVATANPDNATVKTRLSRLRQGLADKLLPPPLEEPATP